MLCTNEHDLREYWYDKILIGEAFRGAAQNIIVLAESESNLS